MEETKHNYMLFLKYTCTLMCMSCLFTLCFYFINIVLMHARCARVIFYWFIFFLKIKYSRTLKMHDFLLIKVGLNKGLIFIKSIFRTLMISYYNGKVFVYLHGGTGFESCPMHVINIFYYFRCFLHIL